MFSNSWSLQLRTSTDLQDLIACGCSKDRRARFIITAFAGAGSSTRTTANEKPSFLSQILMHGWGNQEFRDSRRSLEALTQYIVTSYTLILHITYTFTEKAMLCFVMRNLECG
jgi:hypothetical protein